MPRAMWLLPIVATMPTKQVGKEQGVALIEFALVLPLLLLLTVGIVFYGYALVLKIAVVQAAKNGAQEAAAVSPLIENYNTSLFDRARQAAEDSLAWLPSAAFDARSITAGAAAGSDECDEEASFGVRVAIAFSDGENSVLPRLVLGPFSVPPSPVTVASYACVSI